MQEYQSTAKLAAFLGAHHQNDGSLREFFDGETDAEVQQKMNSRAKELANELGEPVTVTKRRKVGRNEPCPCGSGAKFKKCCIDSVRR